MKKSHFNYILPEELIAQLPLPERTASRLLCLNRQTGQLQDKQFIELIDSVYPDDILVFNNTKVIPARLFGNKESGGKVEILLERVLDAQHAVAHVKASKAPKAGARIVLQDGFYCLVQGREDDLFSLYFPDGQVIANVLARIGHIPLPPYIGRVENAEDRARYQTVFAEQEGAVAAPTAGLHFDEAILAQLKAKGVRSAFVTLHVGSGTFQPVRAENLSDHIMHNEFFSVSAEAVAAIVQAKAAGGRVIAIGTTAVRALESASQSGELLASCGDTRLFITPGYAFKTVQAMVTNFHLPESTLLMLVSAFAGHEATINAYQHAIAQRYRFFSYGDAMFLS
ncbi:MAG: tRNA preQ1(34) S-adenosylmethionine ribosyltransferase-isomerase QueA [Methylovulum sp.]|jgi:S-adenosylmethionine:tRNA ribosyltransferase-isomerase